jgi:LysM repeat protein
MAPFNVLDDISLSGLEITYNFTKRKVDFTVDIGPIDLGLFKITGITLAYNPDGNDGGKSNNKVEITVNGSFAWQDGDSLKWEPDDPATTPAPPGGGNKYFDLRLLALGQHVTVPGLLEETNVEKVIEKLEVLDIPKPPEIPIGGANQPTFDATSSWFVAFDFGVLKVEKKPNGNGGGGNGAAPADVLPAITGERSEEPAQYFISLAIVFNDPHLYALRVALEGPMAKVFAGLDFQIMYQQVSKNVGRYSAQIALPTVMRKFQIGVASITLPIFAIEVYTNGDFQIDIGFPWKEDFSRSFSIELQAGPFPVTGAAGFYFGKLSSATTDKVPLHTRPGWFNPVIVFGFGAQVGLGKSIEAGILRAGFSVTVFGIIEGVIARWQPYKEVTAGGDKNSLQDGYYFALTGTFGLQGRLYGSIDFAIISAELDVRISLYVRITFASYEPIPIAAKASVSVTLTVKINLGLFKISIHLSFKAAVEVTFVLDNPMGDPKDAPWAPIDGAVMAMPAPQRLSSRGLARAASRDSAGLIAVSADAEPFTPVWTNLQPGTTLQMKGWVVPVLTVAGDIAKQPDEQKVCYVLNFFVDGGEAPVHTGDHLTAMSAAPGDAHVVSASEVAKVALERARNGTTSAASAGDFTNTFEDLAIRVLKWVIAAGQKDPQTPDTVDGLVVSDDFLASALSYLSGSTTPTPVGGTDIERFLEDQTKFLFGLEQDTNPGGQPVSAVFFPAGPGIALDVPAFGGEGPFHYSFGGYNSSSTDYLSKLNDYFNELKVQVQQEERKKALDAADAPTDDGPSIATYIFGDYFAMIGRLTIQAMRDGLRDFKLLLGDHKGQTAQEIVDAINSDGKLGGDDAYTLGELFTANQKHPLDPAAAATRAAGMAIATMTWRSPGGKSFTDIAAETVFARGFDATTLALANAASATIIAAGVQVLAPGATYRTQSGDSLETIAIALGFVDGDRKPDVAKMLTAVPELLTSAELLAPQSILAVPEFRHTVVAADTLQTVAAQYGITVDALADANGDVKSLFLDDANNLNLDVPHLPQYQVGLLIDEMKRTLALQHMGAMASRYYLHGLRLPTKFATGGLTPKADGLFVKAGGS